MAIMNKCYLGGKIIGKINFTNDNYPNASFVIAISDNNRIYHCVELIAFENIALQIHQKFKEGDLVVAECVFQSQKKVDKFGKSRYKYRFIIKKIELLTDENGYENTKEISQDVDEEKYPWGY